MKKVAIGNATLYHGDCLEVLPVLSGIDAVIADPQYQLANGKKATTMNATANRGSRRLKGTTTIPKDWGMKHGDDVPYDPSPWLQFPKVILWGAIHYANRLPNSTSWLIWDKREGVASDDNADCEMAWSNLSGPARVHRQLWKGICRRGEENIAIQGDKFHPFQKPVALMSWCILQAKLSAGQTVLDYNMGSGTTGVACMNHGIKFIGIEINKNDFDIACERIDRAQQQLKLAL